MYLPATKCNEDGTPIDQEYVGTLLVKVTSPYQMISFDSQREITSRKMAFINERIKYYDNLKTKLQKDINRQNNGTAKKHNN